MANYKSRIHETESGPGDITLKDPTAETEGLPSARSLSIHPHYASFHEYSAEPENAMTQTNHSPTLTSREYIYRTSPDYLINEISTNAVIRSQKRKTPPQSSPGIISNDSRISIGDTWGDPVTLPIPSEMERRHLAMSWGSYTNHNCEAHKEDKIGARYWHKDLKTAQAKQMSQRKEEYRLWTHTQ